MWHVEQVSPQRRDDALALLVGAGRRGRHVGPGVEALGRYLDQLPGGAASLYWARQDDAPAAAALVLRAPGRTGAIIHSSVEEGVIPPDALAAALDYASRQTLAEDVTLVQALLDPLARRDAAAFERGGFRLLAELIYMRRLLPGEPVAVPPAPPSLTFRPYDDRSAAFFQAAILTSYQESLDCPGLEGVRDVRDVLAGHTASGVFRPDLWTVALYDGRPAGVILLNQSHTDRTLEVVYMGVARDFRGQGLGRRLLARAVEQGGHHGHPSLALAVDSRNIHAMRLYQQVGFQETMRRLAFFRTARHL